MKAVDQNNGSARADAAGVPLGGIGAGCLELGRDGRFRNITINNNRTAGSRIEVAENTFLAVRAAQRGKVRTRLLQASSGVPFETAGIVPTYVDPDNLGWRGLYPCAQYDLSDAQFPIEVSWKALSPIIPYDIDASSLPLVLITMHLKNRTNAPCEVAVVLNWENLCGCTRRHFPKRRGPIRAVPLRPEEKPGSLIDHEDATGEEQEDDEPIRIAGLRFGFRGDYLTNAEGDYCLLLKKQEGQLVSVMGWNEQDPRELEVFWRDFHDRGFLRDRISRSSESHSGAVCSTFVLPGGAERSVVFSLAWYCPRYVVKGMDLGNAYTNTYPDALAVANRSLEFFRYYFDSVENWQERILSSSLPPWVNRILINNNYVLSTNTLYTVKGDFAMIESPANPETGCLDQRLHSSLGPLLFFPELEQQELHLLVNAENPDAPGRLYRSLGVECLHEPLDDGDAERIDLASKAVLMAFRNYQMTGKLFVLEHLYPRLKAAMAHMLERDAHRTGLPEQAGLAMAYDRWPVDGVNSYAGGLWLAALRAYPQLARCFGDTAEAKRYESLYARASRMFENRLWNRELEYYRFHDGVDGEHADTANACHCGQLAGQAFADLFCLDEVMPEAHVRRALGAICTYNETRHGVATLAEPGDERNGAGPAGRDISWPAFYLADFCTLLMTRGYTDRALYILQRTYKEMHARRGRTFNQPLAWDPSENDALHSGDERHVTAMSVWHLYYALLGFYLNVPGKTLWLRPRLPRRVHELDVPLFTPVCFGWLTFRESDDDGYQQSIEIAFDSPIYLQRLVLRVPEEVRDVDVACESPAGTEETEHAFGREGPDQLLEIMMASPVMVNSPLTLIVRQTRGAKVDLEKAVGDARP